MCNRSPLDYPARAGPVSDNRSPLDYPDYRGGPRANRLAGPRTCAVRSRQASEPSSAASLGKNGYGDPAAAPVEPGGYGPTQPHLSGDRQVPSEVVPRSADRPRGQSETHDAKQSSQPHDVPQGLPHRHRPASPSSPRFPDDRGGRARLLGGRRHLPRERRAARGRCRTAATSSSSTTARRSPTACRTTATCSPATSRTSSRATRRCAAAGSSAASAGTPTACPPSSRRCASTASRPPTRSSSWASRSSTRPAARAC